MESLPLALRRCFIYVRYCLTDQLGDQTDGFGIEATKYTDAVRELSKCHKNFVCGIKDSVQRLS